MKRITKIFVLVIASMAALYSCSKENVDKAEGTVLKATFEGMTKTSLGTEYQVLWSVNDDIVYFDVDGNAYTSTSTTVSDDGLTAEFTFASSIASGDVALYPADENAEYDPDYGVIGTTLPATQYPVAGGFDPKANIALSETVDNTAKFYNACSLIGFKIMNDDIKEITLRSSKAFAGKCTVSPTYGGAPEISLDNDSPSDLVLLGDFVKGQVYYAVVVPNEYITFDLTFKSGDGKVAKFENNNTLDLTEKRNCITMIFDSEIPDSKWEAEAEPASVELCTSWNKTLAYGTAYTQDYTFADFNGGTTTVTLAVQGVYRQSAANTYFQMNGKTGYFKNTTKLPGKIQKIETTWSAAKGPTKCYFANDTEASSSDLEVVVTAATSVTYIPNDEQDYYYFNIDVSTGSGSAQLTSCVVYYEKGNPSAQKELVSLEIGGSATKTSYFVGEAFDPAGLTVTGTYSDASTADLTSKATWTINPETFSVASEAATVTVTAKVGEIESEPKTINDIVVSVKEQTYANTYTSNVELSDEGGTSASVAKVVIAAAEYDAIKAGTGKAKGACVVTIPASTKTLHFHAAGWNGETVKLDVNGTAYALVADAGVSGSSSSFTLQNDPETKDYFTFDPKGATTITFAATSDNRFVLFGVNAELIPES